MLQQTVDGLDIRPGGTYVDLTFGGGGHSREILRRLGDDGRLFGFDQDLDAMKGALQDPRFIFVRSNFRFLKNWMRYYEVERVDGILADLGVSSHHLDDAARGFSFRQDAPLDMRMNQKAKCSARTVLRDYTEEQLASVLYLYGELKNSRRLASAIVKARAQGEIMTTGQLAALLQPLLPRDREKKDLARVFQALRIEVNRNTNVAAAIHTYAAGVLVEHREVAAKSAKRPGHRHRPCRAAQVGFRHRRHIHSSLSHSHRRHHAQHRRYHNLSYLPSNHSFQN